jgi:hypothetical protein
MPVPPPYLQCPRAASLDQTILQCLVRPLDAPLGLWRPGADLLDAEPLGDAVELGPSVAALGLLGIDAEDAVPVRVERQRQAVRRDVVAQGKAIGRSRLGRCKAARREPPRRVIDEEHQGELGAPILEPGVLAAVDLDQLAEARAPFAQLENALLPARARPPEPEPHLDLAHRLCRDLDPLALPELLGRKRRPEVRVALAQGRLDACNHRLIEAVVRSLAAPARDEPAIAARPPRRHQVLHLTHLQIEQLRRPPLPDLARCQPPHHGRPLALLRAHPDDVPVHVPPLESQPEQGQSQLCRKGQSELGAYMPGSRAVAPK